jgi:hypothetical protein
MQNDKTGKRKKKKGHTRKNAVHAGVVGSSLEAQLAGTSGSDDHLWSKADELNSELAWATERHKGLWELVHKLVPERDKWTRMSVFTYIWFLHYALCYLGIRNATSKSRGN